MLFSGLGMSSAIESAKKLAAYSAVDEFVKVKDLFSGI